jgi:cytosine/adenosine deaminase-related metal-dependent hydrolase
MIALVDAVVAAAGADIRCAYGPNAAVVHDRALEAIAEASARTGRRVHMHLLETATARLGGCGTPTASCVISTASGC